MKKRAPLGRVFFAYPELVDHTGIPSISFYVLIMCPPFILRFAIFLCFLAASCAQLPPSFKALDWKDDWGSRGEQVLARDYAMCQQLVEQRRGLLSTCMANRGWAW
jgi:hypothetical protein